MYGQSWPVLMSSSLNEPECTLKSGSAALNAQFPTAHLGLPLNVLLPVLKSPHPQNGSVPFQSLAYMTVAVITWRICDRHLVVAAAFRALLSAGNRIAISNAMMPITTSNSTSVKPLSERLRRVFTMGPRLTSDRSTREMTALQYSTSPL